MKIDARDVCHFDVRSFLMQIVGNNISVETFRRIEDANEAKQ